MAPWWKMHVLAFTKEYQLWNHTHNTGAFDSQILSKKCGHPPSSLDDQNVQQQWWWTHWLGIHSFLSHGQYRRGNANVIVNVRQPTCCLESLHKCMVWPYKATSNIKKLIIILTHNLQMCVWDEITKQKIFLILFYVLYLFNPPLWKSTIPTSSSNRHFPNRKSDIAPSFHFLEGFLSTIKREWESETGFRDGGGAVWERKVFPDSSQYLMVSLIKQPRFMSWLLLDSIKI